MNHNKKLDPLMEKLERVRDECLGKRKDPEEGLDDFTKVKKRVSKRIKEIRAMLKRRDALFRANRSDPNGVKLSALVRQQIAEVMTAAEEMQSMYLAEQKKQEKKKDVTEGMEQLLTNREQIVKLTFLHVQELEMLEKQRDYGGESETEQREKLFELKEAAHDTKNGSYGIVALPDVSAFPDIEVAEGFATQEANEARINTMLDQVLDGVISLKDLATAMGTQIAQTDVVIDNLDSQVGAANVHLDTLNTRLKGILTRIRSPRNFVMDVVLVVLFIILIGLLIKMIKDRF